MQQLSDILYTIHYSASRYQIKQAVVSLPMTLLHGVSSTSTMQHKLLTLCSTIKPQPCI